MCSTATSIPVYFSHKTHHRNMVRSTKKHKCEGNCHHQGGKLLIFILQFIPFQRATGQLMELDNSAHALGAQSWLVVRVIKLSPEISAQ